MPAPTAPPAAPGLVVFGVLNPAAAEQVVLLMASRAAAPDPAAGPFTADDPIVSTGETPVTGARVVVFDAAGDSAVLVEDRARRADRRGAGVYRMWSASAAAAVAAGATAAAYLPVPAGGAFRLRVAATVGDAAVVAEGSARVPTVSRAVTGPARAVSLARDSVVLADPGVASASGYVYSLRAQDGVTPIGDPQYRRAFEPRLLLPGAAAAHGAFGYAQFIPGTRVVLTVTAADTNYFAYYGADADPFADRSRRTTLTGASGVFGAALRVVALPVAVSN